MEIQVPYYFEDGKDPNSTQNSLFTYCNNCKNYYYIAIYWNQENSETTLPVIIVLYYVGIQSII